MNITPLSQLQDINFKAFRIGTATNNIKNILKSLKKMQSLIKFEETDPIYKNLDELI